MATADKSSSIVCDPSLLIARANSSDETCRSNPTSQTARQERMRITATLLCHWCRGTANSTMQTLATISALHKCQSVLDRIESMRKLFGAESQDLYSLVKQDLNLRRNIYTEAKQELRNALKEAIEQLTFAGHDCTLSPEDGCAGCVEIERLKDEYSSIK